MAEKVGAKDAARQAVSKAPKAAKTVRSKKGALVAALGAAGLMAAESAQATELMQLAEDNRGGLLLVPELLTLSWWVKASRPPGCMCLALHCPRSAAGWPSSSPALACSS